MHCKGECELLEQLEAAAQSDLLRERDQLGPQLWQRKVILSQLQAVPNILSTKELRSPCIANLRLSISPSHRFYAADKTWSILIINMHFLPR